MTTTPKDGGQAFPVSWPESSPTFGMTLRDWFAAHAPGLDEDASRITAEALAGPAPEAFDEKNPENMRLWFEWWARADASARYIHADAMIAERNAE
jgi:hypothetical protein